MPTAAAALNPHDSDCAKEDTRSQEVGHVPASSQRLFSGLSINFLAERRGELLGLRGFGGGVKICTNIIYWFW